MGGKRPDQYAIDPGEANATDHKERVEDQSIRNADKQRVASTRKQDEESHIPKRGVNPALADLQQKREAAREQQDELADNE